MAKCWAIMNSRHVLVATCLLTMLGCGPSAVPIVSVSGTVSVKGKPLQAGRIFLEPVSPDSGQASPEGSIVGGSFAFDAATDADGVAVGKYFPTILDPKDDDTKRRGRIGVVQLESTILDVTAEGPNEFQIDIGARDLKYAVADD